MNGPVTFSYFDEMGTFGLADYQAARTRIAIAKERQEIERDILLRDKHLGDTLRAYEALGFRFSDARQLLLCGIPRDLVASYADAVPAQHRNVDMLVYLWSHGKHATGRESLESVWDIHIPACLARSLVANWSAEERLVASWLAMRHKAALAAKMNPSALGRLILALAMAVPSILAGQIRNAP